jgi:hypothetical protein
MDIKVILLDIGEFATREVTREWATSRVYESADFDVSSEGTVCPISFVKDVLVSIILLCTSTASLVAYFLNLNLQPTSKWLFECYLYPDRNTIVCR